MTDDKGQDISPTSGDNSMNNKDNNNSENKDRNEDLPKEATLSWTDILKCDTCGSKSMVKMEAPVNYRFINDGTVTESHIFFRLSTSFVYRCLECEHRE